MHVSLRTLQAKYRSRNRDRAMDRAVDGGPWLWPLLVYNGRRRHAWLDVNVMDSSRVSRPIQIQVD